MWMWKDHVMKHSNQQKSSIWGRTTAYPELKMKDADLIQKLRSILLPMTSKHISIKAIEIAHSFGCTKEQFTWLSIIVAMFSDNILAFVFFFIPSGICNEHRNIYINK